MTNHFHLLLMTPQPNLSDGMKWLNLSYTGWYNRRHRKTGHLFGERFKAIHVQTENYMQRVARITANGVASAVACSRPELYIP